MMLLLSRPIQLRDGLSDPKRHAFHRRPLLVGARLFVRFSVIPSNVVRFSSHVK